MDSERLRRILLLPICLTISTFFQLSAKAQDAWNVELVDQIGGSNSKAVFVQGNYAYIGDGFGLRVLDISNPSNPVQLGKVLVPDYVYGIFVLGNYAYVADFGAGLRIINISNPSSPYETGSYDTPGFARDVFVSGNYAYVANWNAGLRIINISNPSAPYEAGYYEMPDYASDVFISGIYAYVTEFRDIIHLQTGGLRIINISNPSAPYEAGYCDTPELALYVFVSGNYAYVTDEHAGLRIINISNPSAPYEAGYYDALSRAHGAYVSGNYAYVADSNGGLRIINISNPSSPYEAGYHDTPGYAREVFVSGDYAYVADESAGLRIINISNPSSLYEAGYYDTPGYACGVFVRGDYAYVADSYMGLFILRFTEAPPAPAQEFFDDFSYIDADDPALSRFDWTFHPTTGKPGFEEATWNRYNVQFVDDPPANRIMRLVASTRGTPSTCEQAGIEQDQTRFREGTYAARIRFTNTPSDWEDLTVQTFFTLNQTPPYAECDFEYLAYDRTIPLWKGPGLYKTTWEVQTKWEQDPWNWFAYRETNLDGWHILLFTVMGGRVKYYLDSTLVADHGGNNYPNTSMAICFYHWFDSWINSSPSQRSHVMDVDWVYHAKGLALSCDEAETIVSEFRSQSCHRRDTMGNLSPPVSGRLAYHSYSQYMAAPAPSDSIDGNIFIYTLPDGPLINLTGSLNVQNAMNPDFSPDGSRITFMAIPKGTVRDPIFLEIYVFDFSSQILDRLTDNTVPDEDPKFSPDGQHMVFKRNSQIWIMESNGDNLQQLTFSGGGKSGPYFSPDGSKIVYWSGSDANADIWLMNADGSSPFKIIGTPGLQEYYPVFRDSDNILYARWEGLTDDNDKIYSYRISSGTSRRLCINTSGVNDSDPFPVNAQLIGFSSTRGGGKGTYDVYLADPDNGILYSIPDMNSEHQDLGGCYSPYTHIPITQYAFETSVESWSFLPLSVPGEFSGASSGYSSGRIAISSANDGTHRVGLWTGPTNIAYVANNVYRARYIVCCSQPTASQNPQFRMRWVQDGALESATQVVNAAGTCSFSLPTDPTTAECTSYFAPILSGSLGAAFDMLDFDGAQYGTHYVDSVTVERFPTPEAGTAVKTYTSSSDFSNWQFLTNIGFGPVTSGGTGTGTLSITSGTSADANFGFWQSSGTANELTYVADKLYRATYTLRCATESARNDMPQVRLRCQNEDGQMTQTMELNSQGTGPGSMPTTGGTEYDVYFETPTLPGSPTTSQDGFILTIDLLDFSSAQGGTIYMDSVAVDYLEIP